MSLPSIMDFLSDEQLAETVKALACQPSDEPCPSSCGVGHMMSHPKAQERQCSCHPDDNPPSPCPQKYALTDCREAELATLRAQLAEMTQAVELARTLVNESRPLDPAFSKVVDKQFWSLLLTANPDHRLGQGNTLDGVPEYHEPKPARLRPLL